jgi:nucleoside 2-deoxyribosyltransferase
MPQYGTRLMKTFSWKLTISQCYCRKDNKVNIYIAGSISGKTKEEVTKYFFTTAETLRGFGYKVYSPMTGKGELRVNQTYAPHGYDNPIATDRAIVGRDGWMVGQSDIVYTNLSNAKVASIGSMFEIAWANMLHKHVVAVVPKGNIHEHAFVFQSVDIIFQKEKEALCYLEELSKSI